MNQLTYLRNIPSLAQQSVSAVVRVVHGTEDVHSVIRRVCVPEANNLSDDNVDADAVNAESNESSETNVNGVWSLSIGSRLFDTNFEAIQVVFK